MASAAVRCIAPIISICALVACGGGGGGGDSNSVGSSGDASATTYQAQVRVTGLVSSGLQVDINGQVITASTDGNYSTAAGFAANTQLTARIVSQPVSPALGCALEHGVETITDSSVTFEVHCQALRETTTSFNTPLQNLNEYMPEADAQVELYVNNAETALYARSRSAGGDWGTPVDMLAAFNTTRVGTAIEKQFPLGYMATTRFKDGDDWVFAVVSVNNQAQFRVTEIIRHTSYIDVLDIHWGADDQVYAMYRINDITWVAHGAQETNLQQAVISTSYARGGFYSAQATSDGSLGFYYYSDKGAGDFLYVGRLNSAGEIGEQELIPAYAWESYSTQDAEDNTHLAFFNERVYRWMYVAISRTGEVLDFKEITPQAPDVTYSNHRILSQRLDNGDLLVAWRQYAVGQNSEPYMAHFSLAQQQWSDPINLETRTGMQFLDDVVVLPTGLLLSGRGYHQVPTGEDREFAVFAHMATDYTFSSVDIASTLGQQDEETTSCIAGIGSGDALIAWHKRSGDDSVIYAKRLREGVWSANTRLGTSTAEFTTINCAVNSRGNALVSWARWINPWGGSAGDVNTLEYAHYLAAADYWSPTIELLSQPYANFPAYIHVTNDGFILNWSVGDERYSWDVW